MTEYEIRDLVVSTLDGNTSVLSVPISVISAYLIVAWLAGARLTRPQVVWISLLFTMFGLMMIFRWVAGFRAIMRLQFELLQLGTESVTAITTELITVIACLLVAGLIGSLKFMWDVRHPKT